MDLNRISAYFTHSPPSADVDLSLPRGPSYGEPGDVIERLPDAAQAALSDLRDRVDALRLVFEDLGDKQQDAWKTRSEAETQYRVLTEPAVAMRYGKDFVYAEDHPSVISAKAAHDKASQKARDIESRYQAAAGKWTRHKRLLTNVENYVAAAGTLKAAPAASLKFPAVDRLAADVERIRNSIAELSADRHAINSAAWPAADAKARARAEIEHLAELGKPRVTQLIDGGSSEGVGWSDFVARSSIHGLHVQLPGDENHTHHDRPGSGLALVAWMFRDRMIEAIEAEIDAHAEDDVALSAEQRAAKLAECESRILAAERIEAALISRSGGTIDPREDMDPRAVLGVDGPKPRED